MNKLKEGYLILILGCMFSSKSTKLLEFYYRYRLKYNCLLINHSFDIRYISSINDKLEGIISTHNNIKEKAIHLNSLKQIFTSKKYYQQYNSTEVILIDEAQFFSDLYKFVIRAINMDNKIVVISGLNGDFKRNNIGDIHKLIPQADDIILNKAICYYCDIPKPAIFSLRITKETKQIVIGNKDKYLPVCRYHYNNFINKK